LAAGLAAVLAMAGFVVALAGPAQAAVPDHWGFAYVDKPSVPGIPDPAHQANSTCYPSWASTPGITTSTGPISRASNGRPTRKAKSAFGWTCLFGGGRCSAA
jgi:hypothetical protein